MKVERYQASGGESEDREYGDDETAQVQVHKKSFTVAWTTTHLADSFMHSIGSFISDVDATQVTLSPTADEETAKVSFTDASHKIEIDPSRFDFIRLYGSDRGFTWGSGRTGDALDTVHEFAEMAVIDRRFDRPWLQHFIGETATPQVIADLDPLLDSVEELTGRFA